MIYTKRDIATYIVVDETAKKENEKLIQTILHGASKYSESKERALPF